MKENLKNLLAGAKNFAEAPIELSEGWGVFFDTEEYLLVYDGGRN